MKHIILILSLVLSVNGAVAQSFRGAIAANPLVSASNYLAYPSPKGTLTKAPKGYVPFYFSHYGRHGSRYLIDPRQYSRPIGILSRADSLGLLTSDGRYALDVAREMAAEAKDRYGELTLLGARQHQMIARRLSERFPEIFRDTAATIDARSTNVIRCILSMENEMQELVRHNPALKITCDASQHDMYYMNNYKDTLVDRLRHDPSVKKVYDGWVMSHVDNRPLMRRLFKSELYADTISQCNKLADDIFHLATIAQNSDIGKTTNLYRLFTTDELYHLWQQTNIWWYLNYGASAVSHGLMPTAQRFLVRDIVEKADSCLKLDHRSATMRFGHESVVLPLVCLLDIDGYGLETSNMDSLENYGWINTKIYPMACNVQFVFYKPTDSKSKKPVLVKVLLNEEEATLPIEGYPIPTAQERSSTGAPFYTWHDLRSYLMEKTGMK